MDTQIDTLIYTVMLNFYVDVDISEDLYILCSWTWHGDKEEGD
jgi:hypothetical protein